MLEREAEFQNHPVIKNVYKKHLDNWKHQFSNLQISSKELSGHIKARRIGLHMLDDTS